MNSHQRRKARRQAEQRRHDAGMQYLTDLARSRGLSPRAAQLILERRRQRFAIGPGIPAVVGPVEPTGPTIAELQRDGYLPTTNKETK